MVQAGMTQQADADDINVSIIAISRLMIRLRQTGRTNDRLRNCRRHVTSQCQDRHLRLIHLRNRMITAEDTARRTPGLRARRPVIGPILKQHHRTARLAWVRARCRWRLHSKSRG